MRVITAIYATLFLILYLYGLALRIRSLRSDVTSVGARKAYGDLTLVLASGLMFVACYGYVAQQPIFHRWFWAAFFLVSFGSLLWSGRFITSLQAEHGKKAGLAAYLVNTALVLPIDLTVFLYAFRSGEIWRL